VAVRPALRRQRRSRLAPHRHSSDIDGLDLRQMAAGNQKRRWILPDTIIFAKPAAP
jgi:hypothetical protein